MKNKTIYRINISQGVILILFLFLTLGNEVIDIPHYIFNDAPTLLSQRTGEVWIELSIFSLIISIEFFFFYKLFKRVRILEGFLPICANCNKIRDENGIWVPIEEYITDHADTQFSHSICEACKDLLYPDLND